MTQPEITPVQALENLAQAAAQFRGTRADHELIERCVRVLAALVQPPQAEKKEE